MTEPFELWTGAQAHPPVEEIPILDDVRHIVPHRGSDGDWFLHGVALTEHNGILYCSWANSPQDENSAQEMLRCRSSEDGGETWSHPETIAAGYPDERNHSHCAFLSYNGTLWAFAASFLTLGTRGKVFPGLRTEAFILDESTHEWNEVGVVADDFWPYEEPKRMADGNWIMGGQDSDSNCIVGVSHGDDLTKWDPVRIPRPDGVALKFAETTTYSDDAEITAVIRYKAGLSPSILQQVAIVAFSSDFGRTWTEARATNLPAGDSKLYGGALSDGRRFLIYNGNTTERRSSLLIATGGTKERGLSEVRRMRYGYPPEPRMKGFAKSKQWSYPYAIEHQGRLIIGYSINKEDCGITIIPIDRLT